MKYAKDGLGLRQHSQVLSYKRGTLPQTLLIYSFVNFKYIEKLANEVKVKIEEIDTWEIKKEGKKEDRKERWKKLQSKVNKKMQGQSSYQPRPFASCPARAQQSLGKHSLTMRKDRI